MTIKMRYSTLIAWNLIWILNVCIVFSENAETDLKSCSNHADCDQNECCTFELNLSLASSTDIVWKCKPLGALNEPCHSLGNVHCPCQAGLRCMAKAVWYFGSGICGELSK